MTAGREFDDRDRDGGALVAIVSQSVANRYFPGRDPIGRRIGDHEFTAEIVGVVGDVRPYTLRDAPVPMVYFPIRQWPSQPHNLAVRVSGDVSQAVASVRAALQHAEPGLVLDNVGTMALQVERNVLRERLVTYLAAAFGGLSLLLGCVGLYGVLSYSVARRTQEFGVRLALGASPRDLTRDVLWRCLAGGACGHRHRAGRRALGVGTARSDALRGQHVRSSRSHPPLLCHAARIRLARCSRQHCGSIAI